MNSGPKTGAIRLKDWLGLLATVILLGAAMSGHAQEQRPAETSTPQAFLDTLSPHEQAWLREHPVIRVAQDPGWPPIEFTDARGAQSGMTAEYLRLVEERLGVKFERVRNLSWQEAYARLQRWEIDLTTTVAVTAEREKFWAFTKPYMTMPIVVVTRADVTYIADLRELAGKKVAVVEGYVAAVWIARDFPEVQLVRVQTTAEALALLQRGEVLACVENMLVVGYYLAEQKMTDLKIAGSTPYTNAQCMAVRKDWATLAGILDKALDSVSPTEREAIYRRWLPLHYEPGFDYTRLWQIVALLATVLLGAVAWNWKLAREIRERKQAEAKLRQSEARWQFAIEGFGDGVWDWNVPAREVVFSSRWKAMLGFAENEIGTGLEEWSKRVHPEDLPRVMADVQAHLAGTTAHYANEHRVSCKDGSWKWMLDRGLVIARDAAGQPLRVIGTHQDITERKRTEEIFNKFFAQPIALNLIAKPDGVIQRANKSFEDLLGYGTGQLTGVNFLDLIHPDDQAATRAEMGKLAHGIDTFYFENRYRQKNGEFRLLAWSASVSTADQMIFAMATDITERQQAEAALRQSEARWQFAVEGTGDGVWDWNVPASEVVFSKRWKAMLGFAENEIGSGLEEWSKRVHPEDLPRVMADVQAHLAGTTAHYANEHRMSCKDGSWKWMLDRGLVIERDAAGQPLRVIGTHKDITERKQAEASLRRTDRALRIASECNQELVRANSETELLQAVCRIVVEHGGYRMAWVGFAEQNDAKSVRPVAQAGSEAGYLDTLGVIWADTERGRGPTGTAIRTGQPVIARDIPTDPSFGPWRAEAAQRNYNSSVAFPLLSGERAFGVLSVYAAESDAFNKEEVALLGELVGDLGYGITALRTRAERVQAERAMITSEIRYRRLFESAKDGILILDAETGMIVDVNPFLVEMLGYSHEVFLGKKVWELGFFKNLVANQDNFAELQAKEYIRYEDMALETKAGRRIEVEFVSNVYLVDGHKVIQCNIRDMTERVRADEKTRQSLVELEQARQVLLSVVEDEKAAGEQLHKLSTIIEQAPLSVVITDLTGAIEYVNPRFSLVTGYTSAEALGQNPRILNSGETPAQIFQDMWATLGRGQVWSGELRNRKKNGETYLETAVIAPVVDAQGRATHYVALKDDITAQKRHEAAMRAMMEKERQVSEMKTRFISVTSHEFRTPMAAALGSVEILANHLDRLTAEKRQELLARIATSLQRMTQMLDEILLLNRVDANRVEVQLAPLDLQSFVHQAIEEIRLGDRDQHRFEFSATGDALAFPSDPNLLHHILSNLLSNAVRYSPAGTLVAVRLVVETARAQLSVEDHGIGIPESDRARIFEPFERGSNVGTIKGTGLGLNIVQRMIGLLGGTVEVAPAVGGGSRFTLTFPRLPSPTLPP